MEACAGCRVTPRETRMYSFKESVSIEARPETVWAFIGDSNRWGEWMKAIRKVELPDGAADAVGKRRRVGAAGLLLDEVITHYDAPDVFGYSVRGPVAPKHHQGLVRIERLGEKQLEVTYATDLETGLPLVGRLANRLVGGGLRRVIRRSLDVLKRLSEASERELFS